MCSASMVERWAPLLIAAFGAALLACGTPAEEERAAASSSPPPLALIPVGPLPGPAEDDPSTPANPFEGDGRALAQGRRFFVQYNCAGCHGDHGGGGMGPSLRDAVWLYGGSDGQIAKSIVEGRANGMPAWGRMLTSEQVWQLTAYIRSLRTEREPEPPV